MDPRQLEEEVDALEPKVERLKALYEQYFLGLEKLEPTTLRTEVDRKFAELRKRRIQATRVRYRLQMLIQRYNTYQQYWARVTREMERGTYMRDVLRVAKRIGSKEAMTILGQKRARMFRELARVQEERRDRRKEWSADDPGGDALRPDAESEAAAAPAPGAGAVGDFEDPAAWDLFSDDSGEPLPALGSASPFVMLGAAGSTPPGAAAAARMLEEDDAPTLPPPSNGNGGRAPSIPRAPRPPAFDQTSPAAAPPRAPATPAPPPPPAAAPPRAPATPAPPPPPVAAPPRAPATPAPPPPPAAAPPRAPATPGPPPPPVAAPPRVPIAARPAPPPIATPPRAPSPPERPPAPAPAPSLQRPPAPANGKAGSAKDGGDDQRMKEIYSQYVAAKRKGNEPVEGLSYDKLRKSLERQADQLRAAHGQRKIDFEVVTKDGRTLIRPVVR